jgi:hypothetical protein
MTVGGGAPKIAAPLQKKTRPVTGAISRWLCKPLNSNLIGCGAGSSTMRRRISRQDHPKPCVKIFFEHLARTLD